MAKWTILYSDLKGEPKRLIVDDTTCRHLPYGANEILIKHGENYNDGGTVFLILNNDDDLFIFDNAGEAVGSAFLTL